jgi:hypothetical protein
MVAQFVALRYSVIRALGWSALGLSVVGEWGRHEAANLVFAEPGLLGGWSMGSGDRKSRPSCLGSEVPATWLLKLLAWVSNLPYPSVAPG